MFFKTGFGFKPFGLKDLCPLCNARVSMAAVCLSGVLDGISMSRVSATLKRALSFRAIEIALRGGIQQPAAERVVEVPKIQCQEFFLRQSRMSLWNGPLNRPRPRAKTVPLQRTVDRAQIMEEKFEGAQNCPPGADSGE